MLVLAGRPRAAAAHPARALRCPWLLLHIPAPPALARRTLHNLHITGAAGLPAAWARLPLRSLDMSSVSFGRGATLPAGWAAPAGLRLRFLRMWNCSLVGTLPDAWAGWGTLEHLDLSQNRLRGTLPRGWAEGGLPALQKLYLEGNQLTGSPPAHWKHRRLTGLQLQGNKLGAMPGGGKDWDMPSLELL